MRIPLLGLGTGFLSLVVIGCGGNSYSNPPPSNPIPAISGISPSSLSVGSSAQNLTINGSGFIKKPD